MIRIKLPVPGIFFIILATIIGAGTMLGGFKMVFVPSESGERVCGVFFFLFGILAFVSIVSSLFSFLHIDPENQTLQVSSWGSIVDLDQVTHIDVDKRQMSKRSSAILQHQWQVILVFENGHRFQVWEGYERYKARWLAQELSKATGKPWLAGSKVVE